jgi:transcriptional regulator with XRE-family HTH domain
MPRERNRVPFAGFGADTKEAWKALGFSQKAFAESIGINPRYLTNIENSGALPSLPVFYEIVSLCKLPAGGGRSTQP